MWINTLLLNSYNIFFILILLFNAVEPLRHYTKKDIRKFREEVRQMFQHAYDGYLKYASGYDELRPLSCDGVDTWGSYSLTLIDALDTLAVMGNYTEFRRVVKILTDKIDFDRDINVSVFETNIRVVGGLLSAHLMSRRAGVDLEPGWPCNGPLLRLAEDVARRLLPAFDTKTGMPYGTVNLRHGVPPGETPITCTAGVGTFIVEFGTLSRLTGDPIYEEVALNALYTLWKHRSPIGLFGNHIDVQTGRWTAQDAGIGAGVDSYYEYLVKGALMLNRPDLLEMFHEGRKAIDKYLKQDDWYVWVSMNKGQVTLPVFQSLEAFWPGVLSLIGDTNSAMRTLLNYHSVWKQYGFLPEFYNIPNGEASFNRDSYPLRPELIESTMHLYRATRDPYLLVIGVDMLKSIQYSAKTPCGYATIKNVKDHRKEDRMESFFLAETTKYLYLLFDPDNFLHNDGREGTIFKTPNGECVIEAGGYIFNTEAHPIDPSALQCCYDLSHQEDIFADFNIEDYYGEILEKRPPKEDKYRCEEISSSKTAEEMIVDIEGAIDPTLPAGEQISAETLKTLRKNSEDSRSTANQEQGSDKLKHLANREHAGIWKKLEELLVNKFNEENEFKMNLTENDDAEILDLLIFLLKNTKSKDAHANLLTLEGMPETKGSLGEEKSLFEIYESRQKTKLMFEIIDDLSVYQKNKSKESTQIEMDILLDGILEVISSVAKGEEQNLPEIHSDILKIMLNAQQKYEYLFNNALQMLTFLLETKGYNSINENTLVVVLRYGKLVESKSKSSAPTPVPSKLDLSLFASAPHIVKIKKRINEAVKKFELLMQSMQEEKKLQAEHQTKKVERNDESENLISAFSKEDLMLLDQNSPLDLEESKMKENDDIILVEGNTVKENTPRADTEADVEGDTTESFFKYPPAVLKQEDAVKDDRKASEYIKPHSSQSSSQEVDTSTDDSDVSFSFVQSVLKSAFSSKSKFEPQLLLEKIRSQGEYINYSKKFELLTCKAQPYLQKVCVWGEVL